MTRRLCRAGLLAALGLCAGSPLRAQMGALEVSVTSAGTPLAAVAVTVRLRADSTLVRSAATDSAGRTRFGELRPARYGVTAERIGYAPAAAEVTVSAGTLARVALVLRESAVGLPGVVVEAQRRRTQFEDGTGATSAELSQRELKLLPAFGEADVLRAIEVLPGVVSTSDFSSSFNVRGGSADQNLILLDGLPVYNPFHLGGLFSVFNADMIARAEMLAGGFPARYGGRVSSVLNIESHPGGSGLGVEGGVSLLATRVAVGFDLPAVERVGLLPGRMRVSARRSYFDQLLRPVLDFPYHLTDVQLYGEAWTRRGGRVSITGYTGADVLDLAGSESFPLKVRWDWGNDVLGGAWITPLGGGRTLEVRAGHTRFNTAIGFPEFGDTEFRSRITQSLLHTDLTATAGTGTYGYGGSIDRLMYDNIAQSGGTVFGQG
ncbi:MAG TPA: TonB-dependent receptor plug domain-containing protein, partial [Longimicrobiales bacterium]|nr:TonB-dependent receptor plug domain-containing protein [Longimicrobiales bacterium]